VSTTETKETELLLKYRNAEMSSKPGTRPCSGISLEDNLLTVQMGDRYAGGVNVVQAFVWNVGTYDFDDKGEIQAVETVRVRVPMRSIGAEWLVVVKKHP